MSGTCKYCGKECNNVGSHERWCSQNPDRGAKPKEKLKETKINEPEPNQEEDLDLKSEQELKEEKEEIIMLRNKDERETYKENNKNKDEKIEPKVNIVETNPGMLSISVVVGDVSIAMNVPNSTLLDVAQVTVDILKNIADLRSVEEEIGDVPDETEGGEPDTDQRNPSELDLEGNREYERLMGTLKEPAPAQIQSPAPTEPKKSALHRLLKK